ncbi:MAG: type site-specific deoxyribonuclease, HsdR family protein, partial [Verrucomicrobiota bacterium]
GAGCSRHPRIDITIVVDVLLTGFDSKYPNTLYVDKKRKQHRLIQAFSRTNRVLNGTKPYGNILDCRQQQDALDAAIALFSGENGSGRFPVITNTFHLWCGDQSGPHSPLCGSESGHAPPLSGRCGNQLRRQSRPDPLARLGRQSPDQREVPPTQLPAWNHPAFLQGRRLPSLRTLSSA